MKYYLIFSLLLTFLVSCAHIEKDEKGREPADFKSTIASCTQAIKKLFQRSFHRPVSNEPLEVVGISPVFSLKNRIDEFLMSSNFDNEMIIPEKVIEDFDITVNEEIEFKNYRVRFDEERGVILTLKNITRMKGGDGVSKRYLDSLFWKGSDKVRLDNSDTYFTFSTDSELPSQDVYRALSDDIKSSIALDKYLAQKSYTLSELSKIFKRSESQIVSFGLRKGINKNREYFTPSDLHASYFDQLVKDYEKEFSEYGRNGLRSFLEREELPLNVHID